MNIVKIIQDQLVQMGLQQEFNIMETKTIQIPEGRVIDREKSTDTTIVMTEDKKIEEICDYIFKYEHYNSFYLLR